MITNTSRLSDMWELPFVEVFETVEGEGLMAGYPTTFVRVFHCNLRCTWCDTPYSYAPAQPEFTASIAEIVARVQEYGHGVVCLTGGEPLMHGEKSQALLYHLARQPYMRDVHVETNGAIDLAPFIRLREGMGQEGTSIRFIMDYKLPESGETTRMHLPNMQLLTARDELKFVVASEEDFIYALAVLTDYPTEAVVSFSPVWESMPPERLVELILKHRPCSGQARLNLQLHKIIWDPQQRGV